MRKKIKILLLFAFVVFAPSILMAEDYYRTCVHKSDIRSLRLRYAPDEDGVTGVARRPFLVLGDDDHRLEVSFDQMSHDSHFYSYRLVHLDKDFRQSALLPSEYLEGYTSADITDITHSSLTQVLYTHYSFVFPNDDMSMKVSGNYALLIYEDADADNIVATVTFQVTEQTAAVQTTVRGNTAIEFNGHFQQLDLDIDLRQNTINSPSEVTVAVRQNNRDDNAVVLGAPNFINGNKLQYTNNRALIFEGGNEYRRFDISSEYIMGRGVDYVEFDKRNYHAYLFPEQLRSTVPYIYDQDANGQFVINAERRADDDFEADYMFVHFFLPVERPFFTGRIFLSGDFASTFLNDGTDMLYDAEHKCYTYTAFLKQGAYEYVYLAREKGTTLGLTQPIEGSHWQTLNEYTIYVYYRPFGCRYDRLIAVSREY